MIDYQSPVFGRINLTIELNEHNYYEAAMYYPNYSNEDKMILYSVFGGEPLYCSLIDENKTAIENVINLMVKEKFVCRNEHS